MNNILKMVCATILLTGSTLSMAGAGHKHGDGGHAGGHMEHMNQVMKKLKNELGDNYNKLVSVSSEQELSSGKKIYSQSCMTCHGESGKGDGVAAMGLKRKPADFTDAKHSKFYSDQGRMQIIKKGIANTAMSGWEDSLSEKEIQNVYGYIRSLRLVENKAEHGHHGGHAH